MLNKPKTPIASRSAVVKNMTRAFALSACLGTIGFATTAQASSDPWVDRVVKVRIKIADLKTDAGMSAVYDRLKSKAERECSSDKASLRYLEQTVAECAQDLLVQFVESSKLERLQNFHHAQTAAKTQTLAMITQSARQN